MQQPRQASAGLAVRRGLNDATLDRAVIAAWWRCCPQANIAIATGARSGVFVLDLDGHAGERSRNPQAALAPTIEQLMTEDIEIAAHTATALRASDKHRRNALP